MIDTIVLENDSERLTARHTAILVDKDSDLLIYPRCEKCGSFLYFLCLMGMWFFHCSNCHEGSGFVMGKN